jgi:hypothetical protein
VLAVGAAVRLVDADVGELRAALLAFSASGSSGTSSGNDCKTEGFDYDISAYVHVGDSVNVTLSLPPNACG